MFCKQFLITNIFLCQQILSSISRVTRHDGFSGQSFCIFEFFFCSVVAIFDLVYDVEAMFPLP